MLLRVTTTAARNTQTKHLTRRHTPARLHTHIKSLRTTPPHTRARIRANTNVACQLITNAFEESAQYGIENNSNICSRNLTGMSQLHCREIYGEKKIILNHIMLGQIIQ